MGDPADRQPVKRAEPMLGSLSLRRNFSWAFAGNVSNTLSQFGMLLVLARLGNTDMVGQYGLGLALSAPIFLLANMSLRNVQVTDVRDDYTFMDYATFRVIALIAGMIVLAAIVWLVGNARTASLVVLLIGLSKVVDGIGDVIYGVFHKQEQMDVISKSMIIKSSLSVVVFACLIGVTDSLAAGIAGFTIVWVVTIVSFDVPNLARAKRVSFSRIRTTGIHRSVRDTIRGRRRRLISLAILSLPAGISAALISLNTNVPRYIIEWTGGTVDLGLFTVLAYPLVAGNTVVSALAQSSLPRLAKYYSARSKDQFTRLVGKLILLAVAMALVSLLLAALFGAQILAVVFGDTYASESTVFLVLVLSMGIGFVNWFLNSALHAIRAFRVMLMIQLAMVVMTAILALLVVPTNGLLGAAWVIVATLVAQVLVKFVVVKRSIRRLDAVAMQDPRWVAL